MGWGITVTLAALTLFALWQSGRCSRLAMELLGAAVLVALAGYGWQGRPELPGRPNLAVAAPSP